MGLMLQQDSINDFKSMCRDIWERFVSKKNVFLTPIVNILDSVLLLCQIHKIICKNKKCLFIQWNLPLADIPNRGHAMNSGQDI